jgi:hypothetical protein
MSYLEADKSNMRRMPQGELKNLAKRYPLCTLHRPLKFGLVTPEPEKPLSLLYGKDCHARGAHD